MRKRRSVALIVETSNAYARGLLDGIIAYQREHELWSIYLGEQERGARPPRWFSSWQGDGIIARIETEAIAAAVRRLKLPTVDVSAARRVPSIPWVETDDREIAGIALRHLLDRGFRNLAFCGEPGFNWSAWRERHFVELAEQAGCQCFVFAGKSRQDTGFSWTRERRRLTDWVRKLPKPVGVMACYDFKGQQLLDVCRELDIAVPEQMAVVGVDNDARLCGLCVPPLSSVIPDTFRAGYEAAKLLDGMMAGEQPRAEALLFPPLGLAQRHSSDVYAIDDAEVVQALRYIREYACEGISVANVLRVVPLSRRMLEHRFRKLVRRSPHEEIVRIRMERACRLLHETELPLSVIADRAGFAHADYLSVAFKKHMGVTPRTYRRDASFRTELNDAVRDERRRRVLSVGVVSNVEKHRIGDTSLDFCPPPVADRSARLGVSARQGGQKGSVFCPKSAASGGAEGGGGWRGALGSKSHNLIKGRKGLNALMSLRRAP